MTNTTSTPHPYKENWIEQKAILKAKFSILSETGLNYEDGKNDELLNKIQIKLGKTKEELLKIISSI